MAIRIIPGAVGQTTLRALVLSDESTPPALVLEDPRGAKTPPLRLQQHGSGDPRFDQHIIGAGIRMYLAEASGLQPGRDYMLGQTHMRTFPRKLPAAGLQLALASCFSDGFGRDADFLRVLQGSSGYMPLSAKFMVGDNIYLDVGPTPAGARTPFQDAALRYLQHFWHSGYANVWSYLPTFTLWDDHEYWNNFPEQQIWLARTMGGQRANYIAAAQAGVRAFQSVLNPRPVARTGLSYQFELPPLSLFALDIRGGRTLKAAAKPQMCSEAELVALERWAANLKGPGALLLAQPLWLQPGDWHDWNPAAFAGQYQRIWRALAGAAFDCVVLSGDVHHSRVLEFDCGRGRRVWEFISSPACHIPSIESIMARAFDVQSRSSVGFPAEITTWAPGHPTRSP